MNEDQNKPTSTRSPKRRIVALVILALVATGAFAGYRSYTQRPRAFIQHWSERFRTVDSLDTAKRFEQSESVVVRTLPSGEWLIATCEHSCCSGAGFDATVIRDSTGAIYADTTHTFCGIEGLGGELSEDRVHATSLAAFYSGLSQLKLQKQSDRKRHLNNNIWLRCGGDKLEAEFGGLFKLGARTFLSAPRFLGSSAAMLIGWRT